MLSQQKLEKTVHFFEHLYLLNQCMFFANFLVKCYPLDTQKPDPNVLTILTFFILLAVLIYVKKIGKICCLVSSRNKDNLFFGHNFGDKFRKK